MQNNLLLVIYNGMISNFYTDMLAAICFFAYSEPSNAPGHFFRVALTKLHRIKIDHLWIQVSSSTPY